MPRVYLRVEFNSQKALEKIKEIQTKMEDLEKAVRELDFMCGTLEAKEDEKENS